MTLKNMLHIDGSMVVFADSYFREPTDKVSKEQRIDYPTNKYGRKRLRGVARRVAEGTWCCQYCGKPFEMDRNAHATRCRDSSLCRTQACYARWKAWHEQVYQTAKADLERIETQLGPDHPRTIEARKTLEWATSRRGARRKNPKPGRKIYY